MNWLLIVIVITIAAFALHGYRLGLIKKVFTMFSFIITILAASTMEPYVSDFLMESTSLYDTLCTSLENVISVEDTIDGALEESGLPRILSVLVETKEGEGIVAGIEKSICASLAETLMEGISFSVSFLLITIILRTIIFTLDIIAKLPLIKGVNQYGGMAIGVMESLIIIWLFFMVVTVFSSTEFGKIIMTCINESEFLAFIYNNNMLFEFIKG